MGGSGEPGQNPSRLSPIDARNGWSVLFGHLPPTEQGGTNRREESQLGQTPNESASATRESQIGSHEDHCALLVPTAEGTFKGLLGDIVPRVGHL